MSENPTHPTKPSRSERLQSAGKWYLLVGGIGLILLYILLAFEATAGRVLAAEETLFHFLNRQIDRTPIWDATMGLLAGRFSVYTAIIITVVFGIGGAWRSRRRNYGQLFGFLGLVMISVLVVEEYSDEINDDIYREAPSTLKEFRAVEEPGEDMEYFNQEHRAQIPDEKMLAWSFGICLMALRYRRLSIFLAIGLLGHIGGQLSTGDQWTTGAFMSVTIGLVLAGIWTIVLDRPLAWIERKSEQAFVALFWRSLVRVGSGSRRQLEPDREAKKLIRGQQAKLDRRGERAWHRLAQEEVLPLMAKGQAEYELFAQPPVSELNFPSRPSRYVRFLRVPGENLLVIKFISRWGGLLHRSHRVQRYAESARANLILERMGFPVPRIYWSRQSVEMMGLQSRFFLVEEFVEGRPIDRDSVAESRRAMELLARLHGESRGWWGDLGKGQPVARTPYLLKHYRRSILHQLRRASLVRGFEWADGQLESIWSAFEERLTHILLEHQVPFRLTHGDVTVRNFLVGKSGDVRMIDFVTARYDLFAWEVVKASISLARDNRRNVKENWVSYFNATDPCRWEEFLLLSNVEFARYAIRELSHNRALVDEKGKPRDLSGSEIEAWIRQLLDGRAVWGETAAETDWDRLFELLAPKGLAQRMTASDTDHHKTV